MFGLFTSLPVTAALVLSAGAALSEKCSGYGEREPGYCNRHRQPCNSGCGCRERRRDDCGERPIRDDGCGCGRR